MEQRGMHTIAALPAPELTGQSGAKDHLIARWLYVIVLLFNDVSENRRIFLVVLC